MNKNGDKNTKSRNPGCVLILTSNHYFSVFNLEYLKKSGNLKRDSVCKLRDKINIASRWKGVVTEAEKFKQEDNGG